MTDLVVSADWLADHLEEVTVVDVRDAWAYDDIGHVPGAVNVPFESFRSASDDSAERSSAEQSSGAVPRDQGMLPGAETWIRLMADAGISEDDALVAYDGHHGVFAARFLVTARCYGHRDLHLLDGDYSAWTRDHPVSTDAPAVETATYEVRDPEHSPLVSREAVEAAIDSDAVLVDTRTPEEFADGHIPGAINLDWVELVDDDTRGLKPEAELEAILADYGITRNRRVVLYCNTARRISHTYVVLRWLGFERVDFYEGSLTEWLDEGGEVVTEG